MRKYFKAYCKDKKISVRSLVDAPCFVYDTECVSELIRKMNQHKISLVIVQDDKRKTCGMITVEDILEELVPDIGEIEESASGNLLEKGGEPA